VTTSITAPDRNKIRWGNQLDVAEIPSVEEAGRAAGYIANHAEFEIMPSSIVMETICP
jgi:hypothetical protein